MVVKSIRPTIEKTISRDIALLYTIAKLIAKYSIDGPRLKPVEVIEDYRSLGLSLKAHPLDVLASPLARAGWQLCHVINQHCDGQVLHLAGLVIMRQRPGTANGTVFCPSLRGAS